MRMDRWRTEKVSTDYADYTVELLNFEVRALCLDEQTRQDKDTKQITKHQAQSSKL
jgi:hypothetical protein